MLFPLDPPKRVAFLIFAHWGDDFVSPIKIPSMFWLLVTLRTLHTIFLAIWENVLFSAYPYTLPNFLLFVF